MQMIYYCFCCSREPGARLRRGWACSLSSHLLPRGPTLRAAGMGQIFPREWWNCQGWEEPSRLPKALGPPVKAQNQRTGERFPCFPVVGGAAKTHLAKGMSAGRSRSLGPTMWSQAASVSICCFVASKRELPAGAKSALT